MKPTVKPILLTMIVFYTQIGFSQIAPFDKLKNLYDSASAPKSIAAAEAAVATMTSCSESSSGSPGG